VDDLQAAGLLVEELQYESSGHHYGVYEIAVERVTVTFEDGEYTVRVEAADETTAERFTRLYEGLR
jgi:hypothetical protein